METIHLGSFKTPDYYDGPGDRLMTHPKGKTVFHAVAAWRAGQRMLSVYAWCVDATASHAARRVLHDKVILMRMTVPRETPADEVRGTLQGMCDVAAVRLGVSYQLKRRIR